MLSYHLEKPRPDLKNKGVYSERFKTANVTDLKRIAKAVTNYVWSPIVWDEGRRLQERFICADFCVLDFDSGALSLSQACNLFCDTEHLVGTTKSHQVSKDGGPKVDRFRVIVRFEERISDLRVYRWNMARILDDYWQADQACRDGARFFFPCREIVQINETGFREDVAKDVPDWFDKRPAYAELREAGIMPHWTRQTLSSVIPRGQRNNTLYRIAKDLTFFGDDEETIIQEILLSPTYAGQKLSTALRREIEQTVKSGAKKALAEMQSWKDKA